MISGTCKIDAHPLTDHRGGLCRRLAEPEPRVWPTWGCCGPRPVHQDVPFTENMPAAIGDEINDLGRWLKLDLTRPH